MFQDTDENPYRPPVEYDGDDQPQVTSHVAPDGVWRWRQFMIVRRDEPVFPQACVFSNASDNINTFLYTAMSPTAELMLPVVLQVPGIGWLLVGIITTILKAMGRIGECNMPLQLGTIRFLILMVGIMLALGIGGNILSVYGFYIGNYPLALLGVALPLPVIVIDRIGDRLFLRTRAVTSEYIVIERVHADYLDRLPEFPDSTDSVIFTLL